MSVSNEKVLEILKNKGSAAAVEQVKTAYNVSFNEARAIVNNILAKNPGIVLPKEKVSTTHTELPVRTFKIY